MAVLAPSRTRESRRPPELASALLLIGAHRGAPPAAQGAPRRLAADVAAPAVVRLPPWVPTPHNLRFQAARRTIEGVITRVVEQRRQRGADGDDLLGMYMNARDETTGERMSDRHLLDELLTLVLAGHETTANAMAFTFYLLAKHPEAAARLRDECAFLGGRPPGLEELAKLPFTRAVIDEALRL